MRSLLRPLARKPPPTHPGSRTSHRTINMSSTFCSNPAPAGDPPSSGTRKEPLALPEVPRARTAQLDMSNGDASVKLDHLGPMVVNADGTLSRIANWENMAATEKEATVRIIGKRNQARLKALREKEGPKEDGK